MSASAEDVYASVERKYLTKLCMVEMIRDQYGGDFSRLREDYWENRGRYCYNCGLDVYDITPAKWAYETGREIMEEHGRHERRAKERLRITDDGDFLDELFRFDEMGPPRSNTALAVEMNAEKVVAPLKASISTVNIDTHMAVVALRQRKWQLAATAVRSMAHQVVEHLEKHISPKIKFID